MGNSANRKTLEKLPISSFTSVMITADQANDKDVMRSDSHTLATLLLVRDIQRVLGVHAAGLETGLEATRAAEAMAAQITLPGRRESDPEPRAPALLKVKSQSDAREPRKSQTMTRRSSWGSNKLEAEVKVNRPSGSISPHAAGRILVPSQFRGAHLSDLAQWQNTVVGPAHQAQIK